MTSLAANYIQAVAPHALNIVPTTLTPVAAPSVDGAVLSIFQTFKLQTTSSLNAGFV